ncbi:MAG: hypothetical protein K8S15_13270 [Candidatus Aegiribacteria sp.]|nr:hypothetical protein [Candidatus Aegiribacteria sp.]
MSCIIFYAMSGALKLVTLRVSQHTRIHTSLGRNHCRGCITGHSGLLWEVHVDEFGILAWSLDPPDGYQKLYTMQLAGQ